VGWAQLPYFCLTMGLVVMLVSLAKLAIFVQLEGVKFSVAQIVLTCCFLSGFFWFFITGLFGTLSNMEFTIVPPDTQSALQYMSYGFTFTAIVVLAFYFIEISTLTKVSVTGIEKMKIPLLCFLAVTWAVVIAVQAVDATDPVFTAGASSSQQLGLFFFSWLAVVMPFACSAVLIYGAVLLVLAVRGTNVKGPIFRLCGVVIFVFLMTWGFGFPAFILNYFPGIVPSTDPNFRNLSPIEISYIRTLFFTLFYMGVCVVLPLNFSVQTSKEIELSKSSTSSTFSGAGSAQSSSSSSADPVIEL